MADPAVTGTSDSLKTSADLSNRLQSASRSPNLRRASPSFAKALYATKTPTGRCGLYKTFSKTATASSSAVLTAHDFVLQVGLHHINVDLIVSCLHHSSRLQSRCGAAK